MPGLALRLRALARPAVALPALLALFALVNGLFFYKLGIKNVADSFRYLQYSDKLFGGYWYEPHNFWYLGYVLFQAVVKLFSQNLGAIITAQVVFSAVGLVALYEASRLIFRSSAAGLLSGLLYVGFFEISQWNFYLLAESVYVSATAVLLWVWAKYTVNRRWLLLLVPLTIWVFFIKPTGIALLAAAAIYMLVSLRTHIARNKYLFALAGLLALTTTYWLANQMLESFATSIIYNDYTRGEVIYGVTTTSYQTSGRFLAVPPTDPLTYPPDSWPPLARLAYFVVHNPLHFAKLWLLKFWYFLGHQRPYWSLGHNLYTIFYLYPTYVAAGYSLLYSLRLPLASRWACLAFFLVHIAIVTITTVDWDGRFLMPLLPVIFLLAGGGWMKMLRKES